MVKIIAHYGYADGSGEYYIIIDTEICDGCGECVKACPQKIFDVVPDDYDKPVAIVKEEMITSVGYLCPGYHRVCLDKEVNCHLVCQKGAISHTW